MRFYPLLTYYTKPIDRVTLLYSQSDI